MSGALTDERTRPETTMRVRDAADVANALTLARRRGLPLAVRSGGHDFAARSSTTGVLIDVGGLRQVSVDGTVASVGSGASLAEVYAALGEQGRTIPGGCGADVGVAGLTLGGGFGVLGRHHGLTSDRLRAAEVVLPDGRIVRCDEHAHPELFWALRGAGHQHFGVVTELVFDTVPAPSCTVFRWSWDTAAATDLVQAWQVLAPDASERLAASVLVVGPADPARASRAVVFGAAHDGPDGRVDSDILAAAFRDRLTSAVGVGPCDVRERAVVSWTEAKTLLADWAPGPGGPTIDPVERSRSEFFARSLPEPVVTQLVDAVVRDRPAGHARLLDLSPWGGAYNRPAAGATAFPHRDARFLLKQTSAAVPRPGRARDGWLDRSWAVAHPYSTGGVYPNFPDPALPRPARAYFGANLSRLRAVKRAYNPDDVLPGLDA